MVMKMQAYVINLPQAKYRLGCISRQLDKIGLYFDVVKAIDGKHIKLPHEDYAEVYYQLMHGKKPNLGEIGCYFSHLEVLRKFLSSDADDALIMEDDLVLSCDFLRIIRQAFRVHKYWDILRLSGYHSGFPIKVKVLYDKYSLCVNLSGQGGIAAYVVNRIGAEKILKHLMPMKLPYDHAVDREWLFGLRTLFVTPQPSSQLSKDSYILPWGFTKLVFVLRTSTYFYRFFNEICRFFFRGIQAVKLKRMGLL